MSQEQHFKTYLTIEGDMWDHIAYKTLGDERMTSQLLKTNPTLTKIVIFPVDIAIIIPRLKELENGEVAPWMR